MLQKGLVYSLFAAVIWGCAPIFDKYAMQHLEPRIAIIVRNTIVFFATLPILVVSFNDIRLEASQLTSKLVVVLGIAGILGGVIGLLLYTKALKLMEASRVVPICSTYPLFAMIMAWIFLGEKLTLAKLGGTLMVILGIFLISL